MGASLTQPHTEKRLVAGSVWRAPIVLQAGLALALGD